jgi:hypothetical protein
MAFSYGWRFGEKRYKWKIGDGKHLAETLKMNVGSLDPDLKEKMTAKIAVTK